MARKILEKRQKCCIFALEKRHAVCNVLKNGQLQCGSSTVNA